MNLETGDHFLKSGDFNYSMLSICINDMRCTGLEDRKDLLLLKELIIPGPNITPKARWLDEVIVDVLSTETFGGGPGSTTGRLPI